MRQYQEAIIKKEEPSWSAKYQRLIYVRHHPQRLFLKNKKFLKINLEINGITSWQLQHGLIPFPGKVFFNP
jgi:hypothetical protein